MQKIGGLTVGWAMRTKQLTLSLKKEKEKENWTTT